MRPQCEFAALTASSDSSLNSVENAGGALHSYHHQLQTTVHFAACQISHKVVQEARLAVQYLQRHKGAKAQRQPSTGFGPLFTFPGCREDHSKYRLLLMAEALSLISSHLSLLAQWDTRDDQQVEQWSTASSQAASDCRGKSQLLLTLHGNMTHLLFCMYVFVHLLCDLR